MKLAGSLLNKNRAWLEVPADDNGDAIVAAILAITDLERLHRIQACIFTASTWGKLLATP